MTGEDYARHVGNAERLVQWSTEMIASRDREAERANVIAAAQVEATLAVASAINGMEFKISGLSQL